MKSAYATKIDTDQSIGEDPVLAESPPTGRATRRASMAWLVWATTAVFVLFQFFLQLSSGEIVDGLMKSFSLTAFGGGVLASTYYYIYTALQTPAGLLIDRFGPRRLLSLGAVVCALGCVLFGSANSLALAVLGRLLMGTGAAFAFVGSLSVIGKWFPPHRFAFMAAIAETIGMTGTIIGGFFLARLVQTIGWRHSIVGAAGVSLLIAMLIWVVVRDRPSGETVSVAAYPKGDLWRDLKALMRNSQAWVNGIYSGLSFSVVTVFVALWAIPFMQLAHHISLVRATLACNLVFIGIAIGGPILGWLDSRVGDRRLLLMLCSFISALLLCVIIYIPHLTMPWVMLVMTVLGIFSSGYVLTFAVANEIVPAHMRGSSMGFVNSLSVGTAPLLQPLIGLILHLVTHHSAGVDHYTVHDYQLALLIMPVGALLSGVLALWIPTRRY